MDNLLLYRRETEAQRTLRLIEVSHQLRNTWPINQGVGKIKGQCVCLFVCVRAIPPASLCLVPPRGLCCPDVLSCPGCSHAGWCLVSVSPWLSTGRHILTVPKKLVQKPPFLVSAVWGSPVPALIVQWRTWAKSHCWNLLGHILPASVTRDQDFRTSQRSGSPVQTRCCCWHKGRSTAKARR